MNTNLNKSEKQRLALAVTGIVLFAIACIVAIILAIRNSIYSARVIINVAPGDAQIIIDSKQYKNGEVALKPGSYHAEISRNGFEGIATDFQVEKDEKYKLYACLSTTESTKEWYDEHKDDSTLCNISNEYLLRAAQSKKLSDPIFKVTPYHSYDKGFNIDPYFDDNNRIIVKITALSCIAERREGLYQSALKYLRNNSIDPNSYIIEKASGC